MNLRKFLDPDRKWFAFDKYQHGVSFYILSVLNAMIAHVALPVWQSAAVAFAITLEGGLIYELGQTDTAYNKDIIDRRTEVSALGTPGFGISPLDLTWDYVGGILGIMTWVFLF